MNGAESNESGKIVEEEIDLRAPALGSPLRKRHPDRELRLDGEQDTLYNRRLRAEGHQGLTAHSGFPEITTYSNRCYIRWPPQVCRPETSPHPFVPYSGRHSTFG
jgi:hypothetical protein